MTRLRIWRRISLVTTLLLLAACSEDGFDQRFENYEARLHNVFSKVFISDVKASIDQQALPAYLKYPSKTVLKGNDALLISNEGIGEGSEIEDVPESTDTLDLLDFLRLYGCDLQVLVAEANSGLGKFAGGSQRLIYELSFLRLAPDCIAMLESEGRQELAGLLQRTTELKKQNLELFIAKVFLESQELREFWKTSGVAPDYPAGLSIEPLQALIALSNSIDQWLAGNYSEGAAELETMLFNIQMGDGGDLLNAAWRAQLHLSRLNQYLDGVLDSLKQCKATALGYSPVILKNVVEKFFVGDVQVWAADLNRRQYALYEAYRSLEKSLEEHTSPDYSQWANSRDQLFERMKDEVKKHVMRLKILQDEAAVAAFCL
jgi:Protein of unknown function (DUF3080)